MPTDYCRTCPNDENVLLLLNSVPAQRSCEDIALDPLQVNLSPKDNNNSTATTCPDVTTAGCCGDLPPTAVCTGADLCGSAKFKPDTLITTISAFQDDILPTCQDFLQAFSWAGINQAGSCAGLAQSESGFLGIERGCCKGREQCSICNEGGQGKHKYA